MTLPDSFTFTTPTGTYSMHKDGEYWVCSSEHSPITAKTVKLAEIKEALTKLEAERDKLASELGE